MDDIIGIGHLQLLRDVLKWSDFNESSWFELGLILGLTQPQLQDIQSTNIQAKICLRECLTLWLTAHSPQCTGMVLADALEEVNEKKSADVISNLCEILKINLVIYKCGFILYSC